MNTKYFWLYYYQQNNKNLSYTTFQVVIHTKIRTHHIQFCSEFSFKEKQINVFKINIKKKNKNCTHLCRKIPIWIVFITLSHFVILLCNGKCTDTLHLHTALNTNHTFIPSCMSYVIFDIIFYPVLHLDKYIYTKTYNIEGQEYVVLLLLL